MLSIPVLAALGLLDAATPDSAATAIAAVAAVDSGAANHSPSPSPQAVAQPAVAGSAADSAWNAWTWTVGATFHSAPLQFGGSIDLEKDVLESVAFQDYTFGVEAWRRLSGKFDLGLGYDHSWLLEFGGSNTELGIGALLTRDVLMVRGRYWAKRRPRWQLGPQLGLGYCWGTLNRFAARDKISGSAEDAGFTESTFALAQRPLSVSGRMLELGAAMEILLKPNFTIGAVLGFTVDALHADDTDPIDLSQLEIKDPKSRGTGNVGVQLHAAYRF